MDVDTTVFEETIRRQHEHGTSDVSLFRAFGFESVVIMLDDIREERWDHLTQKWVRDGVELPRNWGVPAHAYFMRAGWPLYCLRGEVWYHSVEESQVAVTGPPSDDERISRIGAIAIPDVLSRNGLLGDSVEVPVCPQVVGFLVNTVLYSAVILTTGAAMLFCTTWRRMRAGRCLRCGHYLHTLAVCPECGFGPK